MRYSKMELIEWLKYAIETGMNPKIGEDRMQSLLNFLGADPPQDQTEAETWIEKSDRLLMGAPLYRGWDRDYQQALIRTFRLVDRLRKDLVKKQEEIDAANQHIAQLQPERINNAS